MYSMCIWNDIKLFIPTTGLKYKNYGWDPSETQKFLMETDVPNPDCRY